MNGNNHLLIFAAFLFSAGLAIALTKKNLILILIGIELMLMSANVNLVAFSSQAGDIQGQILGLFVILVAVCEAAVGLAISLRAFRFYRTSVAEEINEVKENHTP